MSTKLESKDLVVMEQVIRICQSRGAFKPEEMVEVGKLHAKILPLAKKELERLKEEQAKKETKTKKDERIGAILEEDEKTN